MGNVPGDKLLAAATTPEVREGMAPPTMIDNRTTPDMVAVMDPKQVAFLPQVAAQRRLLPGMPRELHRPRLRLPLPKPPRLRWLP